jgi:hypothetical protein
MFGKGLDRLGGVLSAGCALHCMLVPILTVFWPVLGTTFVANEFFHEMLLYLVLPTALISLGIGCHRHRNFNILASAVVGLGLIVFATFYGEEDCQVCAHDAETFAEAFNLSYQVWLSKGTMILGSILLCWAHWSNYKECGKESCDHH